VNDDSGVGVRVAADGLAKEGGVDAVGTDEPFGPATVVDAGDGCETAAVGAMAVGAFGDALAVGGRLGTAEPQAEAVLTTAVMASSTAILIVGTTSSWAL
jgi:hypothetical protein